MILQKEKKQQAFIIDNFDTKLSAWHFSKLTQQSSNEMNMKYFYSEDAFKLVPWQLLCFAQDFDLSSIDAKLIQKISHESLSFYIDQKCYYHEDVDFLRKAYLSFDAALNVFFQNTVLSTLLDKKKQLNTDWFQEIQFPFDFKSLNFALLNNEELDLRLHEVVEDTQVTQVSSQSMNSVTLHFEAPKAPEVFQSVIQKKDTLNKYFWKKYTRVITQENLSHFNLVNLVIDQKFFKNGIYTENSFLRLFVLPHGQDSYTLSLEFFSLDADFDNIGKFFNEGAHNKFSSALGLKEDWCLIEKSPLMNEYFEGLWKKGAFFECKASAFPLQDSRAIKNFEKFF